MDLSIRSMSEAITVGTLVAVGLWNLAAPPAVAQGVECLNPRGLVQQTICQDPQLADLSQEMRQAVRVVIRSLPRSQRPQLLRDQRDWSLTRNRCGRAQNPRQCLRAVYEERIAELGQTLAASAGGGNVRRGQRSLDTEFSNRVLARAPVNAPPPPPAPSATDRIAARAPVERRQLPQLETPPAAAGREAVVAPPAPDPALAAKEIEAPVKPLAAPETQAAVAAPQAGDNGDAGGAEAGERPVGKVADTLSSGVWRAEITSGIRPGTIYIFHPNGVLLTADCVQAYRLGNWKIAGNGEIVLASRVGKTLRGRIIKLRDRFVRMQIKKKSGAIVRTLILRPAANPFDCSPNQG